MITQLVVQKRSPAYYDEGIVDREITFSMTESEYLIRHIDGLGPVKADFSMAPRAIDSGSINVGNHINIRNIVITLGFDPTVSTVETLRQNLYPVFVVGEEVELIFTSGNLGVLGIKGVEQSNTPSIFSAEPLNQISILCPDPYFYDYVGLRTINVPVTSSLTTNRFDYDYVGDVPVGIIVDSALIGSTSYFEVNNYPTGLYGSARITRAFVSGNAARLNTIKGQRAAQYATSGVYYNAIGLLSGSLVKLHMKPGTNYFSFRVGTANALSTTTIKYYRRYGGL